VIGTESRNQAPSSNLSDFKESAVAKTEVESTPSGFRSPSDAGSGFRCDNDRSKLRRVILTIHRRHVALVVQYDNYVVDRLYMSRRNP
jgi:hypothetical protein